MKRWPIRRPTEHAALRRVALSERPLPPVPAVMAALISAVAADDRRGANLCAHLVVRVAEGVDDSWA